ncbi:hypothetical protein A6A08_25795 [Nocardiopsis sp. TSRI0078]|uniref:MarR family transcriptional regulator n=1 Tax=unclassified Nocardiopsis TaxID=2649073 RepID=UPI0009687913|nr:MarR family transcriptional regulator [Nocardiopsis sp. TSRI0078]OKI17551.1 hypothetical protein A6A08_25795 [Nocardiopsis sp. TSRI0078]
MTIAQRVLDFLSKSGRGWDDDELARQLNVSPRQSIHQACRKLEREGHLHRYKGPDGKIVNAIGGTQPTESSMPSGASTEQQQAERIILDEAGALLGTRLDPRKILTPTGVRVEVDGADQNLTVLVEAWAHQGAVKPAQRHKVLSDALKLVWISSTLYPRPRMVLCLSDQEAARPFLGERSWAAAALRDLGIEVLVIDLPDHVRARLRQAQHRQYR